MTAGRGIGRVVVVSGSRHLDPATTHGKQARWFFRRMLHPFMAGSTTVLHGDCRGADQIGAAVAIAQGMSVKALPADWKRHGRAAGPRRNAEMAKEADFAVIVRYSHSRGSKNMQSCMEQLGKPYAMLLLPGRRV